MSRVSGRAHRAARRRVKPTTPLWAACGAAALVLTLGVSGTLSTWTTAIIGNTNNTVATATAVVLSETDGSATCTSADGAQATVNSSSCTTINKYGGTAIPLVPGSTQTADVTFKNIGGANASSFQLSPGSCAQTPTAGSGTPAAANLCSIGDLTVAVSCSPGSSYNSGTAWSDLAYPAAAPPSTNKSHVAASGDLNAGSSWTCRFKVALASTAGVTDQGITVTQPLTWTLNGA
ncbi:hypothetical protein [Nocardioides terrisoli]|uniref:hypothetical protein n=1 Tax=Nocardioides terrisoli TaxID=3388267 RepID=UPI00287B6BF6|nr:hypothetical protein [Nocardioides marmorisolisilvae]